MRPSLSLLSGLLLAPLTVLAAKSEGYTAALKQTFPIKLTDNTFSSLTSTPRDHATMLLLTAMDAKFGCKACQEFQPEWDVLARSWQKGDRSGATNLVFATLDFADGRQTFAKLGLQHAPVIFLYPATSGSNAKSDGSPLRYDFTGMATAEQLHSWILQNMPEGGAKPAIYRPFNYMKAAFVTTMVIGAVTMVTVAAPYMLPVVQNRNVWAAVSLLLVLLFTSGHMFNHIRKVPYVTGDANGGVSYFANGFQNQNGMETQIIAAIYGILSFAAINLALKCPRIADPKGQQVAVLVWSGGLFLVYSFLLNIFRMKNGGYPFYLPPF
ncbi:oligosaccharyl transferase subunit gamma [Microthyrium microscopicum]|uniref:Oligosaccharyl transferase subunit gamma n=1 Tax=Microthyrium microscopicum TaxID=703497 RepID=A0A6A6TXK6_9PEZI|nr:oligosaccharyl transferase subunit gamma [Microthyrium microscopicum]